MATRCRMDAVQQRTSEEVHMSHNSGPRIHFWLIWYEQREKRIPSINIEAAQRDESRWLMLTPTGQQVIIISLYEIFQDRRKMPGNTIYFDTANKYLY